jgi:hypothetical protein
VELLKVGDDWEGYLELRIGDRLVKMMDSLRDATTEHCSAVGMAQLLSPRSWASLKAFLIAGSLAKSLAVK